MFAITLKTSFFFLTHLGTFSVFALLVSQDISWRISGMAIFSLLWLSSSVLFSERMESYAFLRMLPVTDREIVRTKFTLALAAAFLYWFIMMLVVQSARESAWLPAYMAYVNLVCAISLPLMACWYICHWLFGAFTLTVCVSTFMIISFIAAIILNFGRRNPGGAAALAIVQWLAEAPWYLQLILFLVASAAYYGLMQIAVRVKEKSEACL